MKPLKKAIQKPLAIAVAAVTTSALAASVVVMATKLINAPSSNPWDYTLYAFDTGTEAIKSNAASLLVEGDVRTAGGAVFGNGQTEITENLIAGGKVQYEGDNLKAGKLTEDAEALTVNSVFSDVYVEAVGKNEVQYAESLSDQYLVIDNSVIGQSDLNVSVRRNSLTADEAGDTVSHKSGAFGADFMADLYNRPDAWKGVLPFLYTGSQPEDKDFAALGKLSAFLPVETSKNAEGWSNAELLPENVFSSHLSVKDVRNYIDVIKKDNPVFNICADAEAAVTVSGAFDRSTINPAEAKDAKQIIVTDGNFSLNGTYENLEEIRCDNIGGVQLHGDFPNLKYIYMSSWSNLNLAGDFPSLECVYLNGGQLLLGTAKEGFSAENATVVSEYGSIVMYAAKDIMLQNSRVLAQNSIVIRGGGALSAGSAFRVNNTLFAARDAISIEDMHDINTDLFDDLPVFYSGMPASVVNSDIAMLQGCFLSRTGSMVLTESEIGTLRGYLFAPEGIDSSARNSSVRTIINSFNYNIPTKAHNLNKQLDGDWKKGTIHSVSEARFPVALAETVTDINGFLSDSISLRNEKGEYEEVYSYKGAAANSGVLMLNSALISEGNLNLKADVLKGGKDSNALISSRTGNVTVQVNNEIDWTGVIYAPEGKVTLNGSGIFRGRIFAKEIEIISQSLEIDGSDIDAGARGFGKSSVVTTARTTEATVVSDIETTEAVTEQPGTTSSTTAETTAAGSETGEITTGASVSTTVGTSPEYTAANYEYDKLGRLVKVIYDENNYIEYTYDANGNITKVQKTVNGITEE